MLYWYRNQRVTQIYICSPDHPRELSPGLGHRFIDDKVHEDIIGKLKDAANQGKIFFLDESVDVSYRTLVYSLHCHRKKLMTFLCIVLWKAKRTHNEYAYQTLTKTNYFPFEIQHDGKKRPNIK